jgi:hypothetical protein
MKLKKLLLTFNYYNKKVIKNKIKNFIKKIKKKKISIKFLKSNHHSKPKKEISVLFLYYPNSK